MSGRRFFSRLLSGLILITIFLGIGEQARAQTVVALDEKKRQLQELTSQLHLYQEQLRQTEQHGGQVQKQLTVLEKNISETNKSIQSLEQEIDQVAKSLTETQTRIGKETKNLQHGRLGLAETVRALSSVGATPWIFRIFQTGGLSRWLLERRTLAELQIQLGLRLKVIQETKQRLDGLKVDLQEKSQELATAQALKEMAAKQLGQQKKQKLSDLQSIKNQAQRFRSLADLSGQQISALQEEISSLEKSGITLEEAVRLGIRVGNKVRVRPALLLGVLEVETRLGQFLGTGTWQIDMHPRDRDAFWAITKELGLNPDTQPVSKKPDYGWGGAMGPAQFLPQTWQGYKDQISALTGHRPPSPWNPEDAFTAAALFLQRHGAEPGRKSSERQAVKSYISGDPKCGKAICEYYANLVMSKAKRIEQDLLAP